MKEEKAAIIEKIQKIILKGKDQEGTPEGKAFLQAAARLMAKYRIEESEVDLDQADFVMDEVCIHQDGEDFPQWGSFLISSLCWAFDTKGVSETFLRVENPYKKFNIIGTYSDVETVIYFADILIAHIEEAGWKTWPKSRNWRKRNQLGNIAAEVIYQRLHEIKKNMDITIHEEEGCRAMVVSKEKAVEEVTVNTFPNARLPKAVNRDIPKDQTTIKAGIEAGKSAPLNFGIEEATAA